MATEKEVYKIIRIKVEGESKRHNDSKQSNVTICMVPESLRDLNPSAYTPRIISIGPLHKDDQRLTSMEEHKVSYMYRLFSRNLETESTKKDTEDLFSRSQESRKKDVRKCVKSVVGLVPAAKACYAPNFTSYSDSEFAQMMVIDGCFIIELLYRREKKKGEGDPIFGNTLVMNDVTYDLMLLENQIPFFILEVLFSITLKRILKSTTLTDLIFCFFKNMNFINNRQLKVEEETNKGKKQAHYSHILGLLQSCYRPISTEPSKVPTNSYSATEMAGAGVIFKAHKPPGVPRDEDGDTSDPNSNESKAHEDENGVTPEPEEGDIHSDQNPDKSKAHEDENGRGDEDGKPSVLHAGNNGVPAEEHSEGKFLLAVIFKQSPLVPGLGNLIVKETSFRVPQLNIRDSTSCFLRNLIAYEQCYPRCGHYVTSFAFLMDRLIDTKDDVSLLVNSNIIFHNLGACEDVANLWNNLCKGVNDSEFYYGQEWEQLQHYCKRFWPSNLIALRRLYKSTTWKTLTVIAAVIIFFLTLIQTCYSVKND